MDAEILVVTGNTNHTLTPNQNQMGRGGGRGLGEGTTLPCGALLERCTYLLGAEPEGEGVAHVERGEKHAVADSLGDALLHSGPVGTVQVLVVAL